MEINKKDLSIIDSFKIIFSRRRLGEEAAMEHIKNNKKKTNKDYDIGQDY